MLKIARLFISILIFLISIASLHANDSEYHTSGNQLIPITNTDIRLDKEVLKIMLTETGAFRVDVNYTLFNEGEERNITIGFEAPRAIGEDGNSPQGYFGFSDRNDTTLLQSELKSIKKTSFAVGHPDISDFTIIFRDKKVPYRIVSSSLIKRDRRSSSYIGYLYYFHIKLKKGMNSLEHKYRYFGQGSVQHMTELNYILETASRWKGGEIGDFTLILDMGEKTQFSVYETFFRGFEGWKIMGRGAHEYFTDAETFDDVGYSIGSGDRIAFYINDGEVIYHKKNFIPKYAVLLDAEQNYFDIFDSKKDILWISTNFALPALARDAASLGILKAFPRACKGKAFKNKITKEYYTTKTQWYKEGRVDKRTWPVVKQFYKRWLKQIEKNKRKILLNLPFAIRGYIFHNFYLTVFYSHQEL